MVTMGDVHNHVKSKLGMSTFALGGYTYKDIKISLTRCWYANLSYDGYAFIMASLESKNYVHGVLGIVEEDSISHSSVVDLTSIPLPTNDAMQCVNVYSLDGVSRFFDGSPPKLAYSVNIYTLNEHIILAGFNTLTRDKSQKQLGHAFARVAHMMTDIANDDRLKKFMANIPTFEE